MYPGALLYLTYWFPARHRAHMTGWFQLAIPVAGMAGGPISGWIMATAGGSGLANWQWLFLLEGIPSLVIGAAALAFMVDRPAEARWLTQAEKQLVLSDLEHERQQSGPRTQAFGAALRTPRLWLLSLT